MGYSTSPYTLIKIEEQLLPLCEGKILLWSKPFQADRDWSSKWAYKIREACYIAKLYPDRFPRFSTVAEHVVVSILDNGDVEARLDISRTQTPFARAIEPPTAQDRVLPPCDSIQQIIVEYEGSGSSHYPSTQLPFTEVQALAKWGQEQTPKLMVLYSPRTTSLTLAPDDPEVAAYMKVQP